jgi:hypothetical protein
MTSTTNGPLVKLAGLYENRSQKTGDPYFVGYMGGVKVLLLRDKKAAEGQPGWALFVSQRPERTEKRDA